MVLITPPLVLVNVITVGYELVPTLRPTFTPNDTVPSWWASTHLPPSLRPQAPKCQPNDMGRGNVFRVTPSLFEYRVLSTWNEPEFYAKDQGIIPYTGAPFDSCAVNSMRFDYNRPDGTQTVIVGVGCSDQPVWSYLETRIDFSEQISRDYIGQYYGHYTDLIYFLQEKPNDYRSSVFGAFDAISTDSLRILSRQHLPTPVLSLTVEANMTSIGDNPQFFSTSVAYLNGTVLRNDTAEDDLGVLEIYRDTISNLMKAVQHAVHLDLGNIDVLDNIFVNKLAVNQTFSPNLAPASIDPDSWGLSSESWYWGFLPTPYRTWAEALRAGKPDNITLRVPLTEFPRESTMVTNYLCPQYQLKSIGSLLVSVAVGTLTMLITAWGVVNFASSTIAGRWQESCFKCTCDPRPPLSRLFRGAKGDNADLHPQGVPSLPIEQGPERENVSSQSSRVKEI